MDDASLEHAWYLDMETGELLLVSAYTDREETAPLRERLEAARGRYEFVPRIGSSEVYRDMEDFITTCETSGSGNCWR